MPTHVTFLYVTNLSVSRSNMTKIKEQLHQTCLQQVQQTIQDIEAAIADRREAMYNETKSSMGDKYETTREMLQQDINMNQQRLKEAKAQLAVLNQIDFLSSSEVIVPGSIVQTDKANYYIAISGGKLIVEGQTYYVVSVASPVGQQLAGKGKGDRFSLNGVAYIINEVF